MSYPKASFWQLVLGGFITFKRLLGDNYRQTAFFRKNMFDYIYKKSFHLNLWEQSQQNNNVLDVLTILNISKDAFILDAGCGSGRDSVFLLSKEYRNIYGFDISSTAISQLKAKYPKGHFIVADAKKLPYHCTMFDVCFDVGLLHCLPPRDQLKMKNELLRVLKDNGYYIVRVFRKPSEYRQQLSRMVSLIINNQKIHFPVWWLTIDELRKIFQDDFSFIQINENIGGPRELGFIVVVMQKKTNKKLYL